MLMNVWVHADSFLRCVASPFHSFVTANETSEPPGLLCPEAPGARGHLGPGVTCGPGSPGAGSHLAPEIPVKIGIF